MTPYREPSQIAPRAPVRAIVIRGAAFWLSIAGVVLLLGAFVAGIGLAYGATLRCTRASPSDVGTCRLTEPITLTTIDTSATSGAVHVEMLENDDVMRPSVMIANFHSVVIDENHARAIVARYEAFVGDRTQTTFSGWFFGQWPFGAIVAVLGLVGAALVARFMKWQAIGVDVAYDRLTIEKRRFFRPPIVEEHVLSALDAVEIDSSGEDDLSSVVLVMGARKVPVLRTMHETCESAKRIVARAIDESKRAKR